MLYMVTLTINIPPMLALYIPYMDPMGLFPFVCQLLVVEKCCSAEVSKVIPVDADGKVARGTRETVRY